MLFIPKLPVKVEYTAMIRMLSKAKNAKQGLGGGDNANGKQCQWKNENAEYAYCISLKDFKDWRTKAVPRAAEVYGRQLKILQVF